MDTFLNYDYYKTLSDKINKDIQKIKSSKNKLKEIKKYFDYLKIFDTQGAQGITGLLSYKELNQNIVFKLSVDLDRAIEHEYLIVNKLNKLRNFCPHFMSCFDMINLPISNNFIKQNKYDSDSESEYTSDSESNEENSDESENEEEIDIEENSDESENEEEEKIMNLFDIDKDNFPTNLLLLEYVSNISFYHICKYSDKNTIFSQIYMLLMALQIGQNKNKFTHYDLHMDNILIKQIEENTYFSYKFNDKNGNEQFEIIPTYGFYPVIIDMGSSYIKELENNSMYTDITNYQYGLQPILFDELDDLHHLLLSSFYYMQDKSDEFYYINHKIMNLFKHIKVYRKKGWKKLPTDLMNCLIEYILYIFPDIGNDNLFNKFDLELLEIISYGITLPLENNIDNIGDLEDIKEQEKFKNYMIDFLEEMNKFDKLDLVNDLDLLYIVREVIEIINKYRKDILIEINTRIGVLDKKQNNISQVEKNKKNQIQTIYKKIDNECKQKVCFLITEKFPKIDFEKLSKSTIMITNYFSKIFNENVTENIKIIREMYDKTNIKQPYDIYKIIKQNISIRNKYDKNTKIYIMDSIEELKKEIIIGEIMTEEEIEELNKVTINQQKLKIKEKIKNKK